MPKILILLLFSTFLLSQEINYKPQFTHSTNKISWGKTIISGSALTLAVFSIYQTGKPIYYNEPRVSFWFTRNKKDELEWYDNGHRGMDKWGHVFAGSLFAQNIYYLSRWSGFDNKASSYTSFILASTIMGAMEVHDAYYKRWGFTLGDFVANLAGAGFFVGQQNIPWMRNFDYKMSYDFTTPKEADAVVESYANMTYWLTANPSGLTKMPSWFPNWLNIAAGISITHSHKPQKVEFLIGLDYNLKRIKTDSILLNKIIHLLDRYHFPAPALRLAPGFIGYGLYF